MTNSNTTAKKLYKVFAQKHNADEINCSATKLNISIDEAAHRVDVFMDVNRKTLKGAYKVFIKAIEQAVADGALDKKVAEFACFADDINDIDFAGKDYFIANDNLNNSFAYGIDDNGDNGYYFWFWTLTEAAEEIADNTVTFNPTDTPKPFSGKLFDYDICEYNSVEEYIGELKITQSAVIMENLFKNKDGSFSYDGWGRKTYYMTDCYREAYYVACDTENVCLDAESTAQLIYAEQQLKNIVNGSDGSEEDIDEDNSFEYLPALDELNDVDIDDDGDDDNNNDTQSAAEDFVEEYIFIDAAPVNHIVKVKCTCTIINGEELLTQAGTPRIVRSDKYGAEIQFMTNGDIAYYTFDDKNFDRQAEADFFAIMADRGACTIELDEPEPVAMSDDISDICKYNPDVEDDDKPCLLDWDDSAIGMDEDESDKIFADPAVYAAAVEAAFKAQYPEGKAILKPAC